MYNRPPGIDPRDRYLDVKIVTLLLIFILAIGLGGAYLDKYWIPETPTPPAIEKVERDAFDSPRHTLSATAELLKGMDGSDNLVNLFVDVTNKLHTGFSHELHGIEISGITGDTDAHATAVYIGEGWDCDIETDEGCFVFELLDGQGVLTHIPK